MSVHGFQVLIVFNERRTHAWFKQFLKLERMSPLWWDENAERALGASGQWTADDTPPAETGADLRLWCWAALAASGLHYTEALRAFTSWLIISQLLIVVAFKELPKFSYLVGVPAPLKAQCRRPLA